MVVLMEAGPSGGPAEPSLADAARADLARHAWRDAYDRLSGADGDAGRILTPEELELFAQAAWWIGRLPEAISARERGFAAASQAGDDGLAAATAVRLARDNLFRNNLAVANAWLNRAQRLLGDQPEHPGHGWLAATRAFHAGLSGRPDASLEGATRAVAIARRFHDRDLEAVALSQQGMTLVTMGRVEEGMALADEATIAAVGGGLTPDAAGGVCCTTIEACAALGDWRRASEWTEAQDRWCKREGIMGFPGMCRLFRADIKQHRGSWLEAEAEARHASEELVGFIPAAVGQAYYQIGEVRLHRGDLEAAEAALLRAHALGRDPEPMLSLVRLAQGRPEAAAASIKRALEEPSTLPSWLGPTNSDLGRLRFLPARVETAIAAGDIAGARQAADELGTLAQRFGSPHALAEAAAARAAILFAEGDPSGAIAAARLAIQAWTDLEAPYETARARETLAAAADATGDTERGAIERRAAHEAFERLGAAIDARRTAAALERPGPGVDRGPAGLPDSSMTRAFMFTDIVDSTKLGELLGDDAWGSLIRWHDQTVRTAVSEHGGEEIKGTGDGFFVAFESTDAAVSAAVAIQGRFAAQRQTEGFAPSLRIGVHRAEARRTGLDYIGTGVNQAARIAAAAEGGEILVSASTLVTARTTVAERGRRTLTLKGLRVPVEVVSVDWG